MIVAEEDRVNNGRTTSRNGLDWPVTAVVAAHRGRQESMGTTITAEAPVGVPLRTLGRHGN